MSNKIKDILILLENKVDAGMSQDEMLVKAKKYFELEEQIDKLAEQLSTLEGSKDVVASQLMNALEKVKGNTVTIGNIYMKLEKQRKNVPSKTTFRYKEIMEGILEAYEINNRFLMSLKKKYKSVSQKKSFVQKDLIIQKDEPLQTEAKKLKEYIEKATGKKIQLIKEANIFQWIKSKAQSLVGFFQSWGSALDKVIQKLQGEVETTHVD